MADRFSHWQQAPGCIPGLQCYPSEDLCCAFNIYPPQLLQPADLEGPGVAFSTPSYMNSLVATDNIFLRGKDLRDWSRELRGLFSALPQVV